MNPEPREELISAYLDDELAPPERAEVERIMAEQPALRQLHDELAALRATIQSLPRHKLAHDLGPAVLRRAERSVLRGGAPASDASEAPPKVSLGQRWSQGAGWRRLAWPAIAVAAALLIALFDSDQQAPQREVAHAPKGDTAISARPAPPADGVAVQAAPAAGEQSDESHAAPRFAPAESAGRSASSPAMNRQLPALDAAPAAAPATVGAPATALQLLPADVEFSVRPDYLQDKRFEKLLAQHDVKWTTEARDRFLAHKSRSAQPAAEAVEAAQAGADLSARVYTVEATSPQLDALLVELRKNSSDVKQVVDRRSERDKDGAPPANAKRTYRVLIQALPVPAAAPADADKN